MSSCVYILASSQNGTLYIGVTSDLSVRVTQHKDGTFGGFTAKHAVHHLIYYEFHPTMDDAITREKQLKKWNRAWKIDLIEAMNPEWIDLHDTWTGEVSDGPGDWDKATGGLGRGDDA